MEKHHLTIVFEIYEVQYKQVPNETQKLIEHYYIKSFKTYFEALNWTEKNCVKGDYLVQETIKIR